MIRSSILQQKSDIERQIIAILILLRETHGLKNKEIAETLAVRENYLSSVFKGRKAGGRRLLAALTLLKEVIQLRAEKAERLHLLALKEEVARLESGGSAQINEAASAVDSAGMKVLKVSYHKRKIPE